MAVNTKAVKQRIGSVKNTKKITNAMQMIAAVKMRKSVQKAVLTRPYATLAGNILERLSDVKLEHALTAEREISNELIIMITSNRGLCGSYNTNVMRNVNKYIEQSTSENPNKRFSILALGRKSALFAKKLKLDLVGVYENFSEEPRYEDIFPISADIIKKFTSKEFDHVTIAYTNYISGLFQENKIKTILPVKRTNIDEMLKDIGDEPILIEEEKQAFDPEADLYEFEPSRNTVLNYILPVLIEIQLYQSIIEAGASEHSSRMIAMKNATESAGEMIDELTLEFNKARQAAITQEVSEIVSGANALG